MKQAPHAPETLERNAPVVRRAWVSPAVRTEGVSAAPVLLCRTGAPYVCGNSNCCDIAPSCDYLCNGG